MPLLKINWLTDRPVRNCQSVITAERRTDRPALPRAGAAGDNSNSAEHGDPRCEDLGRIPSTARSFATRRMFPSKQAIAAARHCDPWARLSTEEGLGFV
jgi:hypothetical protein